MKGAFPMRKLYPLVLAVVLIASACAVSADEARDSESRCPYHSGVQTPASAEPPAQIIHPDTSERSATSSAGSSTSLMIVKRPASEVAGWYYSHLLPGWVQEKGMAKMDFSKPSEHPVVSSQTCWCGKGDFTVGVVGSGPTAIISVRGVEKCTSVTIVPRDGKTCDVVLTITLIPQPQEQPPRT